MLRLVPACAIESAVTTCEVIWTCVKELEVSLAEISMREQGRLWSSGSWEGYRVYQCWDTSVSQDLG